MSKLLAIHRCADCTNAFSAPVPWLGYSSTNTWAPPWHLRCELDVFQREIPCIVTIPDWCPLPDAEEKAE